MSIIHVGPEVVNNTTNVLSSTPSSLGFGYLESMVVLLAGSLIFLGLGVRLHFIQFSLLGNEPKRRVIVGNLINSFTLLFFFGFLIVAIIFSLYPELLPQSKFAFIGSLLFLLCFVFKHILDQA